MNAALLAVMLLCSQVILAFRASEGLKFLPFARLLRLQESGLWEWIYAAMGQAFFTLSLGIRSMAIFGSYIGKERTLTGESVNIIALDTFVALMSGLIIFPASFAFGVSPGAGPSLIFITLPNIFNAMQGGRLWGTLFFVFMSFAALSTLVAVFREYHQLLDRRERVVTEESGQSISWRSSSSSMPSFSFNIYPASSRSDRKECLSRGFIVSSTLLPLGRWYSCSSVDKRAGVGMRSSRKPTRTRHQVPEVGKNLRDLHPAALVLLVFIMGY